MLHFISGNRILGISSFHPTRLPFDLSALLTRYDVDLLNETLSHHKTSGKIQAKDDLAWIQVDDE